MCAPLQSSVNGSSFWPATGPTSIVPVIAEFPEQVAQYRGGKQQIYGFLVGQVMKRTAGRADAKLVNGELRRQLDG